MGTITPAELRQLLGLAASATNDEVRAALGRPTAAESERLVDAAVADHRLQPTEREQWLRHVRTHADGAAALAALSPGLPPPESHRSDRDADEAALAVIRAHFARPRA